MSFRIIGTGSALPERVVSNDELSSFLDTSDEWIRTRTGISERRVCTDETLDELAVLACRRALKAAEVEGVDIDLIVCSTTSGDHLMPAQACAVAAELGIVCPAFDISAACAGFVFALDVVDGFFARGRAQRALIVSAEKMSRLLDWSDRATCALFGDGAAACVVEASGDGLLAIRLATAPDLAALSVPGLAGKSPFAESHASDAAGQTVDAQPCTLTMEGRRVFKFGVMTICDAVHELCQESGIAIEDIDHFIFHQANERILSAASARLGLDDVKVARTLARTGNISSACIPYTLDTLARSGKLKRGELVALVGFGAGLDTGSCLLRWS